MSQTPAVYAILAPTKEHREAVQWRAFVLGYKWTFQDNDAIFRNCGSKIFLKPGKTLGHDGPRYCHDGEQIITLDDLYRPPFTVPTVTLNSECEATVRKGSVRITGAGNLTLPISLLDELLKAREAVMAGGGMHKGKFSIPVHSHQHCEAVQRKLFELGFEWGKTTGKKDFDHLDDAKSIQAAYFAELEITYSTRKNFGASDSPPIPEFTLDDLYSDKFTGVTSQTVKINSEYSAVVSKEKIVVGCQEFKPEVLDALKEANRKLLGA